MDILFALPIVFLIFFMQTLPVHATLVVSFIVSLTIRKREFGQRIRAGAALAAVQAALLFAFLRGSSNPAKMIALLLGVGAANTAVFASGELGWKKMLAIGVCYFLWCLFLSDWRLPV